jgi:predicted kinase
VSQLLHEGKSVIFDTNFNYLKDREHLRQIAAEAGARTVVIWLTTGKKLAHERAVAHPSPNETRIWGNMPEQDFQRISSNLQEPRGDEHPIMLEGENLTRDVVMRALATLAA